MNPWDKEEFIDFLNDVNELATDKYGWNVVAHDFQKEEVLDLTLMPAIGSDSMNRKF